MKFPVNKQSWPKDSLFKAPDYEIYFVQCQECAYHSTRGNVLDARECPRCGGLMTPRKGWQWNTKKKANPKNINPF